MKETFQSVKSSLKEGVVGLLQTKEEDIVEEKNQISRGLEKRERNLQKSRS